MTADEPVMALHPSKVHLEIERTRTPCPLWMQQRQSCPTYSLNATDKLCGPLRLPLNGFTYSLFKVLVNFPYRSLSDSCPYLDLNGVYHPLWVVNINLVTSNLHLLHILHTLFTFSILIFFSNYYVLHYTSNIL